MRQVLVTGGAGYIGSHTAKLLKSNGVVPIVYDNLSTGHLSAVHWGPFEHGDVLDTDFLVTTLEKYRVEAVIHFAASAYVGESMEHPAKYYKNNVVGMLSLLEACRRAGTKKVIFSSSCATYGVPDSLPITEASAQNPINPYGRTKLIAEAMLRDYALAYDVSYVALRYFNASGSDPEGELREWHDPETHLIPNALLAASGKGPPLHVFGDDYDTADGTCVRDYIHVTDLAYAHLRALDYLVKGGENLAINLGAGRPSSIRQIINAIEKVTGKKVPIKWRARRAGDPPALYTEPRLAREVFGFEPRYSDLETIIRTAAPFFGFT